MAKESKRIETGADPSDEAIATLAALQAAGPGAMAKVYVAMLEGFGDLGSEVMQFVAERISEDVKTQHAIMKCSTPSDLVQIQQQFLKTAFDQYTAETGKLVKLSNDMVHSTFKNVSA